jgi:hypothetical protein
LNENAASLKYNYTLVIGASDIHSVWLLGSYNHSIIPGFRVIAKGGIIFSTPTGAPFLAASQEDISVNILADSYTALNFAGASLGLEKFLFKSKIGALSVSAAYQAVYFSGDILKNQFDHGAVAMLLVYFSGLAMPGMGLGAAYNADKNSWQFAFNLGISF